MKDFNIKKFINDHFVVLTTAFSLLISALYMVKGFQTQFLCGTWIIIGMNVVYVPLTIILKKRSFPWFYAAYGLTLIFLTAFEKTYLMNNYSPLFVICLVMGLKPKWDKFLIVLYFIAVSVAFVLNEEPALNFLIHIVRACWFISCTVYVLDSHFERKSLVLFEDEKKILNQLLDGKVYQKEVDGFSENTIYRKLKAARERNNCKTRDELLEKYRATLPQN